MSIPGLKPAKLEPSSRSLAEVNRSIPVFGKSKFWIYAGPALLVSVGYMDPGNWATDLAGGAKYGYALLWVILLSNLMAQLLQVMAARLGVVTGKDLAQACRDYVKKPGAIALWILCEIAIIACDLAEVIGSAVALNLLFNIPLLYGVLLTTADVLILLTLMHFGFRKLEALVLTLVSTIAVCFALNVFWAKPDMAGVLQGTFVPTMPDTTALLIAVGIIGATVMPHNLYLHTSVVQTRDFERDEKGKREAIRFNTIDTVLSLSIAFFVNAAILILAAAVFHSGGIVVEELEQAHALLVPTLGGAAATAFAVALLASGQSSTITATLAGQIVMEGFLRIRVKPWLRRLVTRLLAVVPAAILVSVSNGTGTVGLLVLSQVVLSMQLAFATVPLVLFTSDKGKMGEFVNPTWMTVLGWIAVTVICSLNFYLLYEEVPHWLLGSLVLGGLLFGLWVQFVYKEKPSPQQA